MLGHPRHSPGRPARIAGMAFVAMLIVSTGATAYEPPGVTELVSRTQSGAAADGATYEPIPSPDGSLIAFQSFASNFAPGDDNQTVDVFVREIESGELELISRSSGGAIGDQGSFSPVLSEDGRFVAFGSYATN